jgi:hypothetical protein
MRVVRFTAVAVVLGAALLLGAASIPPAPQTSSAQLGGEFRFEISFSPEVHSEAVTGRVFVMLSPEPATAPFLEIGRTGIPFFGSDVERLAPGEIAFIDNADRGSPHASLSDLPEGEYYAQAFVNIYSEFRRADGHVVWMHDDRWEGQQWNRSPGNLYSEVAAVTIDPSAGGAIRLEANREIGPIQIPPDTEWVRRFRFESPMLTAFWGRPIYLGATVLLPRDYDAETHSYPVVYEQGHFSPGPPMGFVPGGGLYRQWTRDDFPEMIVVTFQHPNPYFDDSYAVNSVNVGPYGDAIMEELIPEIERRYRIIEEPWARALTGGSTGGWEALALQIFHPDFFGGTWSYCPDPVDFHDVEQVNLYEDTNAYYREVAGRRVPIPNTRETDGAIRLTSEQRNHFELANGTRGRSGEQFDIWSAVHGPIGDDGYFRPLFDKLTGEMDPEVARHWIENYDLRYHLERNWTDLGPKLDGKLHIYTGTMDNFYLNNAVKMLEDWLQTTRDPHVPGYFEYGVGVGHCYTGTVSDAERLREIAGHMVERRPEGAAMSWH